MRYTRRRATAEARIDTPLARRGTIERLPGRSAFTRLKKTWLFGA